MKRPEETNYPTDQKQFENSVKAIENAIDSEKFTLPSHSIVKTKKLEDFIASFGWKLEYVAGDFREGDSSYYKLLPI